MAEQGQQGARGSGLAEVVSELQETPGIGTGKTPSRQPAGRKDASTHRAAFQVAQQGAGVAGGLAGAEGVASAAAAAKAGGPKSLHETASLQAEEGAASGKQQQG